MKKGFTLLEILLVIAAIGILAAIVIVAINPNRQLAQVRDAQRSSDTRSLLQALEQYLIDNNEYPSEVVSQSLNSIIEVCAQGAGDCTGYLDLESALVPTYLASIPNDPSLAGNSSGYAIAKTAAGVGVTAIASESDPIVSVGPKFTPDLLNGLVSWYDFSDEDTYTLDTSGGIDSITSVTSKHNSSNSLSQATKSDQPRLLTSERSEKSVASFESSGQMLIGSLNTSDYFGSGSVAETGAIVVAFDPDEGPVQDQYMFQFPRNGTNGSFLSFTTQSWLNGNNVTPNAQDSSIFYRRSGGWLSQRLEDSLVPEDAFIITASFDDSLPLTRAFLNESEVYSVSTGTSYDGSSGDAPFVLGNNSDGTASYYGDIFEVLIFDRALTNDEIQTLVIYLTYKYNLE